MEQLTAINIDSLRKIFGSLDKNVKTIEEGMGVRLFTTDGGLRIVGESEETLENTKQLFDVFSSLIGYGFDIDDNRITQGITLAKTGRAEELIALARDTIAVTAKGKHVKCKTVGQRYYVKSIAKNTVTFGVGPAGTGKTYLAVAMAVTAYKNGEIQKIILTRPAIEAGEHLGFLPGDLQMKVDPYLRPLYDALEEMFGMDKYTKLLERGVIEIAPLAYMRGRTLSDAFIILDEAQNATSEQMKMFLTRFGENSKVVVTGDLSQSDLPHNAKSGLKEAITVLAQLEDVAICTLTDTDVVRNKLVQKIILAYDKQEKDNERKREQ